MPAHGDLVVKTRPLVSLRPDDGPKSPRELLAKIKVSTIRLESRYQVIGLKGIMPNLAPLPPAEFLRSDTSRIVRHS